MSIESDLRSALFDSGSWAAHVPEEEEIPTQIKNDRPLQPIESTAAIAELLEKCRNLEQRLWTVERILFNGKQR